MNDFQIHLSDTLRHTTDRLRKAGFPNDLVIQMERLVAEIPQPCVVAVVGRVKAGKSTFINALLGEDLAKVGRNETTATINYFLHGLPDPDRPVHCYWRSGKITSETRQFLDSLQGNDIETLHRADGIDHLEYHIQNSYLEQITLVDTPGTGAVVEEHQVRTSEFLQLHRLLRERHDQETRQIGSKADAVIYLIGEVARVGDQAFLDEFREVTQDYAHSLNAIGVMAKIDLNHEIIERREELARKIAGQLQNSLNTVIPVSAGIQRGLDDLLAENQAGLKHLVETLHRISPQLLNEMLSDPDLYEETDCPVSAEERKQVRGMLPWQVFKTIAEIAADNTLDLEAIIEKLKAIAGFERLHQVLDQHFVKRGSLLRSYRIANDALKLLKTVKFTYLPNFQMRESENAAKRETFLTFLRQARQVDPATAKDLEKFIWEQLPPHADLNIIVEEMEREIGLIESELASYNADFEALTLIENHASLLSPEELSELQPLFGLYGLDIEKRLPPSLQGRLSISYLAKRQEYWDQKSQWGRTAEIRKIAEFAGRRYGIIADALD